MKKVGMLERVCRIADEAKEKKNQKENARGTFHATCISIRNTIYHNFKKKKPPRGVVCIIDNYLLDI